MANVSVVIVSYRTPELTRSAVLSALDAAPLAEVVVVDNASGDESVAFLRSLKDERIRLYEKARNVGYGVASNSAARESTGDILLLLNSDAVLSPAAMRELTAEVERHDGRCVAGARLVGADGVVQRSAGVLPRPLDLAARAIGLQRVASPLRRWPVVGALIRDASVTRDYESAAVTEVPMDTTMVSGACLAVGRAAFLELGGFDERFFMYFEDADLCRRAAAAGMPIRYVPSAVVTHIGGASSSEDYHFGPLHARAMRQYLGKWYGPGGSVFALVLLWLRAFGMTLLLQGGARRARRAWWAALRDEDPRH